MGEWRKAVKDADRALELGQDQEREEELTFLLYNAARTFAQAAGRISVEMGGRTDAKMNEDRQRYEARALDLLEKAVLSRPEAERRTFWQQATPTDSALLSVRPLLRYRELEKKYGQPPK
jgi:hypothetical protein